MVFAFFCNTKVSLAGERCPFQSIVSKGPLATRLCTMYYVCEGMVTSGNTVEPLGPFPVIKAGTYPGCNHQTGSYKLK